MAGTRYAKHRPRHGRTASRQRTAHVAGKAARILKRRGRKPEWAIRRLL